MITFHSNQMIHMVINNKLWHILLHMIFFTKGVVEPINDEATKSITLGAIFFSQYEIIRITDNPVNYPNAPDDQTELKLHTQHIKFVDVKDEINFQWWS